MRSALPQRQRAGVPSVAESVELHEEPTRAHSRAARRAVELQASTQSLTILRAEVGSGVDGVGV